MYDATAINARRDNAWPTDTSDVTDGAHEFSPVLQAPVANLLGTPWYLESGGPGGDFVTWRAVGADGRLGTAPQMAGDGIVRWVISWTDADGNPLQLEQVLSISATAEQVVARVHAFMDQHGISAD